MTDQATSEPPEELGRASMLADLMSTAINLAKALPAPWQQLSEEKQSEWLEAVEKQCASTIDRAVPQILSGSIETVRATVDSVTFKKGIKAALKMPRSGKGAHALADAEGTDVFILIADTAHLVAPDGKPEPDPDQPEIPLNNQEETS